MDPISSCFYQFISIPFKFSLAGAQLPPFLPPGHSHSQRRRLAGLAQVVPPEGFPERFHQCELQVHHDIDDGLLGRPDARGGRGAVWCPSPLPTAQVPYLTVFPV